MQANGQPIAGPVDSSITYDPDRIVADLLGALGTLERRLHSVPARDIVGTAILDRLQRSVAGMTERVSRPFRVVVGGEFKRGKSTLINALLGAEIAPTDPLPETVTINSFTWGDTFTADLRLIDGGRKTLERAALRRDKLLAILESMPRPATGIDVRLPLPALRGIEIVDTPGTGDLPLEIMRMTREYLADADLLIVVISALAPLSLDERTILRSAIRKHDFPKILFVLNMIDAVRDRGDVVRLTRRLSHELGTEFPGSRVYPLSAYDEVARVTGVPRPKPDDSVFYEESFQAFRADLEALLSIQHQAIRADRVGVACRDVLTDVDSRLGLLGRNLEERTEVLEAQLHKDRQAAAAMDHEWEQRRTRVCSQLAALGDRAAGWMETFADRVITNLPAQLREHAPGDIERNLHFFIAQIVEQALAACVAADADAMTAMSVELLGDGAELSVKLQDSAHRAASIAYSGPQRTTSSIVSAIADRVLGLGTFVDIGLGLLSRGTSQSETDAVIARIEASAAQARHRFAHAARSTYGTISARLVERLDAAAAAAREAAEEAARQAVHIHSRHAGDVESARNVLAETRAWVEEAAREIQQARAKSRAVTAA